MLLKPFGFNIAAASGPPPGGSLVDNQGDTYFTSGSESDTKTLYLEANFIKQTDGVTQYLYETNGRSRVELKADNGVYIKLEDTAGAVIWDGSSTETITIADGLTELIVEIDTSVPSLSVTKDGVAMTFPSFASVADTNIEHSRLSQGWLADPTGGNPADLHIQDMRVSFDGRVSYVFDIDAASGATALNAGTQNGTASLTRAGTGFLDI